MRTGVLPVPALARRAGDQTDERTDVMDLPPVAVYLDGARCGTVTQLRSLRPSQVTRLEFLSAAQATGRFGSDHVNGAILVTTGR